MPGGARTFLKVVCAIYIVYSGPLIFSCRYIMLAFIGTTFRSLLITSIIMSYVKVLLFLASTSREHAERRLENFDAIHGEFLKLLDIPNIRQFLSGFAYLSSSPKEDMVVEDTKKDGEESLQQSVW